MSVRAVLMQRSGEGAFEALTYSNLISLSTDMQVQTAIKVGQVDRDFVIQRGGVFQMADGYPIVLTAQQATFEMKNWDEVSLPSIVQMLNDVREWAG